MFQVFGIASLIIVFKMYAHFSVLLSGPVALVSLWKMFALVLCSLGTCVEYGLSLALFTRISIARASPLTFISYST